MKFSVFKQTYTNKSDEALMLLVINDGNEKAFEQLYDRYCKKLIAFSTRILMSKEIAEDIVHDAFIKIIDNPKAFNPSQTFSTWVYTLVNNASINAIKLNSNRSRLLEENYFQMDVSSLKLNIDAKLIQNRINELFKNLSDKEKSIFVLRFEQDLSIKEIAKIIEIPEGSVKSCLYYLLKKISEEIKYLK